MLLGKNYEVQIILKIKVFYNYLILFLDIIRII